jgi:general secretion pathway protein D
VRIWLLLLLLACGSVFAGSDRVSLIFDSVSVRDLARVVYGEIAQEPFILSHEVLEAHSSFSVSLRGVERSAAVRHIGELLQSSGFAVERRAGVVWIGKALPLGDEIIVYRPQHRSARYLADVVQSVTGARSLLARGLRNPANQQNIVQPVAMQNMPQPVQQHAPESITSAAGLVDRSEVDQVAFSVEAKDVFKVRKLLADLDTPAGEVVLKAAVYEVGTDRQEGSALKLAASILGGKLGFAVSGSVLDGVSLKLVKGGIEAVLSALDADSRFRSVSRPQVRVRNGAQARFAVGSEVPVLGAAQLDKNGNPVQSVDYRQSGVILLATPEIRVGVIELNLSQELSNFVATSTGVNNSPTLIKRAVSTRLSISPGEVVILAGLQDDKQDEQHERLPFFGWLLGTSRQSRQSEILVLIEAQRI